MEQATSNPVGGATGEKQAAGSTNGSGDGAATGRVEEIQGVVIEVAFPAEQLPDIYNALEIDLEQFGEQEGV